MMFSVALLFEALHPESKETTDEPLWEESIVLINAPGVSEAISKAEDIARKAQVSYHAISGDLVRWRFVRVLDTYEIIENHLKDGVEVFSRFLRTEPHTPRVNRTSQP